MEDGWKNSEFLQIPTLRSSASTNSITQICSVCKKNMERRNLIRLSYQNPNVSFSANCLSPTSSKGSNYNKFSNNNNYCYKFYFLMHASRIDVCDLPNQNPEKKMCTKSNERVLLKGATLDDSSSPRVSNISCQCHCIPMSHSSNCDWSVSHGNLIELSNRLHPQSNQIAQVSSDILRVSGYTNQYRHLLSGKSKRDSGSETYLNRQKSLDYDGTFYLSDY
uniref:Uncharacterized protein n=1 Tax=Strongyloides venezuelensis TaxID=75913 RepID=A0A0K0F4R5_STRVS